MSIRVALIALLLLVMAALAQAQEARQKAWGLLRDGQEAMRAGRYEDAERLIGQARDADPNYPDVYANLGFLYEHRDRVKALDAYGHLLTLRPEDDYGRSAFKRLFFEGPFPRVLRAPYLAFSPVNFTTDEVRLVTAAGPVRRRLAYTTSLLFHEDMDRGAGPVAVPMPVTGTQAVCQVNRSCYGYVMPADTDRYSLAFILSYPSATLSNNREYLPLATRLMHFMLRCYWYDKVYLGRDVPGSLPVKGYMCDLGPAGASSYQNALYFYDLANTRTGTEWAREVGHEMGHLLLPAVGRFTRPEPLANGYLGERLFMQFLAREAELVAGEPWPAPAAQEALAGLWPGEELQVADYLQKQCRTSLDYYLAAGPDSPLGTGTAEDGMQYWLGFMLWTQATYGTETLRLVMQNAAGTAPADFIYALRQQLRKQAEAGPLTVNLAGLNLPASKLAERPLEGAFGRTQIKLSPGDSLALYAYLPEGGWSLSTAPVGPGVTVTIDGRGPLPLGDKDLVALGRVKEGWHTLLLQREAGAAPLVLERVIFSHTPEA